MTLLLSANFGHFGAVQVADRRLTQPFPNETRRYDYANKQLVIRCEDAILIASFTGVARLSDEPTDDWIARALLQTKQRLTFNFGGPTLPLLSFSDVHRRLAASLQEARVLRQLRARERSLAIAIIGLRRAGETTYPEPFWAAFRVSSGQFSAHVSPRYQYFRERAFRFVYAGSGDAIAQRLVESANPRPTFAHIADLEDYLVDVNRRVAAIEPTVGPDATVTSVNFAPDLDYDASVRFCPRPNGGVVRDVYTPWLLGPGFTMPPSATMSGGATVGDSSFRVRIEASPKVDPPRNKTVLAVAPAPRPGRHLPPPGQVVPTTSTEIIQATHRERLRKFFEGGPPNPMDGQ